MGKCHGSTSAFPRRAPCGKADVDPWHFPMHLHPKASLVDRLTPAAFGNAALYSFFASPGELRVPQDYSSRRVDRKRRGVSALTKRAPRPLTGCDRRSLVRERIGNAVRNEVPKPQLPPQL